MRQNFGPAPEGLEESELSIPVRDGWLSEALVIRPAPAAQKPPGPVIVMYHGGGFIAGAKESMIPNARGFARLFDAVVVAPSYRLAPENKFPVGINDAWDVLQWIAKHAGELRADPAKGFVIGGGSAGGNFVAVLARRAVEESLQPAVTGQWLAFPAIYEHTGEMVPQKYRDLWTSWEQNKHAMLVDAAAIAIMFAHYEPTFSSPLYNPLFTSPAFKLAKMPRAFVQVAGMDLVRDDGILYAYALEDEGVEVRLRAYAGVPHTFWAFVPALAASREALVDVGVGMGWLLGREVERGEARKALLRN